jgi:GNAT superfamily N-acetyltransferase
VSTRSTIAASFSIEAVAADHPDALALLVLYFAELRARLSSYEPPSIDALRADGERGVTLLLAEDGVPMACGALRLLAPPTAEVKRMFVVPSSRGRGHARRILHALEEKARTLGCARVVLDTAGPLHEAAAMYVREGYARIPRYNDNPFATAWFEKKLD